MIDPKLRETIEKWACWSFGVNKDEARDQVHSLIAAIEAAGYHFIDNESFHGEANWIVHSANRYWAGQKDGIEMAISTVKSVPWDGGYMRRSILEALEALPLPPKEGE